MGKKTPSVMAVLGHSGAGAAARSGGRCAGTAGPRAATTGGAATGPAPATGDWWFRHQLRPVAVAVAVAPGDCPAVEPGDAEEGRAARAAGPDADGDGAASSRTAWPAARLPSRRSWRRRSRRVATAPSRTPAAAVRRSRRHRSPPARRRRGSSRRRHRWAALRYRPTSPAQAGAGQGEAQAGPECLADPSHASSPFCAEAGRGGRRWPPR